MQIAIVALALVAAAFVVLAISVEREPQASARAWADRAIARLGSWPVHAGSVALRRLRGALPLAARAKAAVTRITARALDGGASSEGKRVPADEPAARRRTGRIARVRFRDTLEMTHVRPAAAPPTDALFGDGYGPGRPVYQRLTAVRLVLALVAIGLAIGLILLGIVIGIRVLIR